MDFSKIYYVYILTNLHKTVLYVGVTNNLKKRLDDHYSQRGNRNSFTGRYNCYHLIYYEEHFFILNAIAREKEIKGWRREKKMKLISEKNQGLEFIVL
jgi:putative endonuclease